MGEMKIDLLPDAKPIKKQPYKLSHRYKNIVKKEIHNMLVTKIIYLLRKLKLARPMVIQPKKHDPKNLCIHINFWCLNQEIRIDPYPTPFPNEIINEVARHECYFTDGFSSYN